VISYNNKPLHLEGVDRRSETDKERNEGRRMASVNKFPVLMPKTDFVYVQNVTKF
jgi:hypothetical protein